MRGSRVIQVLALVAALFGGLCAQAQDPGGQRGGPRGGPGGFGPGGPGFGSWWERPWWGGPMAQDLNLSETQKTDIRAAVKELRDKMMEVRAAIRKADADVEAAFGENPVDQRKASDAIDRLASARGGMTRTLSLMSLKIRNILTAEQWQTMQQQEMQRRERFRRGERGVPPFGQGTDRGGPPTSGGTGGHATKQ